MANQFVYFKFFQNKLNYFNNRRYNSFMPLKDLRIIYLFNSIWYKLFFFIALFNYIDFENCKLRFNICLFLKLKIYIVKKTSIFVSPWVSVKIYIVKKTLFLWAQEHHKIINSIRNSRASEKYFRSENSRASEKMNWIRIIQK